MLDRYALFGNPVEHSPSPFIHQTFVRQTGQSMLYEKILTPLRLFSETIKQFHQQGGKGANVTLPFKQQAFQLADTLSERARLAGAVNTLKFLDNGELYGDNTDGAGMIHDIQKNLRYSIKHQCVLLLGAGGAARGVLLPLLHETPRRLVIANRTAKKALNLAQEFAAYGDVSGLDLADLGRQQFDLIINATSASLNQQALNLPGHILKPEACCYDMVYSATLTPFLRWARAHGAAIIADGLGMLIEQAAESFFIWRGVRPETKIVYQSLREKL